MTDAIITTSVITQSNENISHIILKPALRKRSQNRALGNRFEKQCFSCIIEPQVDIVTRKVFRLSFSMIWFQSNGMIYSATEISPQGGLDWKIEFHGHISFNFNFHKKSVFFIKFSIKMNCILTT